VAVVTMLAAVVALQPASFTVERSLAIQAPADVVQAHIQDLRAMDAWSPWLAMDPQMEIAYAGPPAGVGARSSWQGPQMGEGRLTVTALDPEREIEMQLEMIEPMQATHRIRFALAEAGGATTVTWRMEGRNGFVGKALALVMDMDAMVGDPFERGLASLRSVAEADAAKRRAGPMAAQAAAAPEP
jgi:hypothetical protein